MSSLKQYRLQIILSLVIMTLLLVYPKVLEYAKRNEQQRYLERLGNYEMNLLTPQGAILCLEDAYRKKDIEAAVACKDFYLEAVMMLEDKDPNLIDDKVLLRTASVLELGFRKETQINWPDFNGLDSYFEEAVPYKDNVVSVKEICRFPDGGYSTQTILVGKRENGWKVLYSLD